VQLAARPPDARGEAAVLQAFGRPASEVEADWRRRLDELTAG
jgi:hypothetical protein